MALAMVVAATAIDLAMVWAASWNYQLAMVVAEESTALMSRRQD